MTVTVRAARAADADALFVLLHALATSFTPDRAAFDTSFAVLLSDDDVWLWVADDAGEVVGYCLGFVHRLSTPTAAWAWSRRSSFARIDAGRASGAG